jgi:hypothetical protein
MNGWSFGIVQHIWDFKKPKCAKFNCFYLDKLYKFTIV